jgi:ATP-dependent DNA helicase RecG
MRPDVLNPLFAEVETLKGVGPQLLKPLKKLGLTRVVDLLFHVPLGWIDRKRVQRLDEADVGRIIAIELIAQDYRQSGGPKAPLRIHAADAGGDYVTLTYFRNPGWAKQQLPLGEPRLVSGKLDRYGQELQMVHPDHVLLPAQADQLPAREPVYALSEGLTNKRMGDLAAQALERLPGLGEWIEPSLKAKRGWPGWAEALAQAHGDPAEPGSRERIAYDEVFANQLALSLVRAGSRRRKGLPLRATAACAGF